MATINLNSLLSTGEYLYYIPSLNQHWVSPYNVGNFMGYKKYGKKTRYIYIGEL